MVASAPTFARLAPTLAAHLSGFDLAGYNVERFDRRLLATEFRRAGVDDPTAGAQAGTSLADLAATDRTFLEWILRKDFSDEVKMIVRDALTGRFPVRDDAAPQ